PFHRTKNMKEGDNIGKISLMVADKKNIPCFEVFDMFRAADLQLIDQRKTGVRKYADDGINNFTDDLILCQFLPKIHGQAIEGLKLGVSPFSLKNPGQIKRALHYCK